MRLMIPRYDASDVIGLPASGQCITISNSEIGWMSCLKKHWFGFIEGMESGSTIRMDIGNGWDEVMGDVATWWMERDTPYRESFLTTCAWCVDGVDMLLCDHCRGDGLGPWQRAVEPWQDMVDAGQMGEDDMEQARETLFRMAVGYIHRHQGGPLQTIKIVAVQQSVARAIINPATGKPYRPETFMRVLPGGEMVLARTGDLTEAGQHEIVKVAWPVYQVGKIDVLGADRRTNAGWVIDSKSTIQPSGFVGRLGVDPQLPGYCWVLEPHLEHFGLNGIAGFFYDIASTAMQRNPKELKWKPPLMGDLRAMAKERGIVPAGKKSEDFLEALGIEAQHGGFSLAQSGTNASCPTWRFEAAIKAAGLNEDDYSDHLDWAFAEVDPKFYRREFETYGDTALNRYEREVFAKARTWAAQRRHAVRAQDEVDIDVRFPRTPICTIGNRGCSFRGPCSQDSPESREGYDVREVLRWAPDDEEEASGEQTFDWGRF